MVPPPRPACGHVEVESATEPTGAQAALVREAMREKLAALGVCARPYRIHVDLGLEQLGADGMRARLRLIVYANSGALAGEIPTALSINHFTPGDIASKEALLRAGADQAAVLYTQSFH